MAYIRFLVLLPPNLFVSRDRVLLEEQSRQLQSPDPLSPTGHEKVAVQVGGRGETAAVEASLARNGSSSRRRAEDVVDMLLQKAS